MTLATNLGVQCGALVGLSSGLAIFSSKSSDLDRVNGIESLLGASALLAALFVAKLLPAVPESQMLVILTFLSGLLGGRAAIVGWMIGCWARVVFEGPGVADHGYQFAVLGDTAVAAYAGCLVGNWMHTKLAVLRRLPAGTFGGLAFAYAICISGRLNWDGNEGWQGVQMMLLPLLIAGCHAAQPGVQRMLKRKRSAESSLISQPSYLALADLPASDDADDKPDWQYRTLVLVTTSRPIRLASAKSDDQPLRESWAAVAAMAVERSFTKQFGWFFPRSFPITDNAFVVILQQVTPEYLWKSGRVGRFFAALSDEPKIPTGVRSNLRIGIAPLPPGSAECISIWLESQIKTLRHTDVPITYWPAAARNSPGRSSMQVRGMVRSWMITPAVPMKFQPKVELESGRIIGAEALIRGVADKGEAIPPLEIIQTVRNCGVTVDFDWCVIHSALNTLQALDVKGSDFHVAVNVSASSFHSEGFGAKVIDELKRRRLCPKQLCIELTETEGLPEGEVVNDNFSMLGSCGVRLSIDDFGSGYSALTLLARFPFIEMKLDGWLTARLKHRRIRNAVELAVIIAKRYDADLVAEGIETQDQCDALVQMGIKIGQGFLFSPAISAAELITRFIRPNSTVDPALAEQRTD